MINLVKLTMEHFDDSLVKLKVEHFDEYLTKTIRVPVVVQFSAYLVCLLLPV